MIKQVKTQAEMGCLYIVATPMGNRQDITQRAIETLKLVDIIAAEDTRHSMQLLQYYGIVKPLIALHEHNERDQVKKLIDRLSGGESIAVMSDAGTPLISDPGYHIVRVARQAGINVVPIPGPCALIAALSVAGLPTDRFVFEGFLPAKSQARRQRLITLQQESRTMIFYESPHRILDLLHDMEEVFGSERTVVIARELTKRFETIHGDTIHHIIEWIQEDVNQQKGEFVVMVAGVEKSEASSDIASLDDTLLLLLDALPLKKAVEIAAKITGKRKNEIYQRALQIKK